MAMRLFHCQFFFFIFYFYIFLFFQYLAAAEVFAISNCCSCSGVNCLHFCHDVIASLIQLSV